MCLFTDVLRWRICTFQHFPSSQDITYKCPFLNNMNSNQSINQSINPSVFYIRAFLHPCNWEVACSLWSEYAVREYCTWRWFDRLFFYKFYFCCSSLLLILKYETFPFLLGHGCLLSILLSWLFCICETITPWELAMALSLLPPNVCIKLQDLWFKIFLQYKNSWSNQFYDRLLGPF